ETSSIEGALIPGKIIEEESETSKTGLEVRPAEKPRSNDDENKDKPKNFPKKPVEQLQKQDEDTKGDDPKQPLLARILAAKAAEERSKKQQAEQEKKAKED
ncbi:hypothetical protein EDEG_04256, partial [Edhazardia aedis USNM 41457]